MSTITNTPTRRVEPATPPTETGGAAATGRPTSPGATLLACFLGMFVVTLDAVAVNVALPQIGSRLGGGMSGLQWVVDGYTLALAALLLSAGSLGDRWGSRRAFGLGMALFVLASAGCAAAPTMGLLVSARVVQGCAAALLMPASMALLGEAYTDPVAKARAVGYWALGGAVASSAGPVLGGALVQASWRWIFLVNLPVGAVALAALRRTAPSPRVEHPLDVPGLLLGAGAMGGLTVAAIEAGSRGLLSGLVLGFLVGSIACLAAFVLVERRTAHPMLPLELFASPVIRATTVVGLVFMACYYGTPFVVGLELQQHRGMGAFAAGLVFLPMMLVGAALTPFSARLVERFGRVPVMVTGLVTMALGLAGLAAWGTSAGIPVVSGLLLLVGIAGPTVMPPVTAAMLNAAPAGRAGTASGVLNTSRQVGGALAVAVFGALLQHGYGFGVASSMLVAAALCVLTVVEVSRNLTGRAAG